MNLLSNRCLLAIAAVVDIALYARPTKVVDARSLAARLLLPPRHLESTLQALARANILMGRRGPRGGYQLAREGRMITVGEIARTWKSTIDPGGSTGSSRIEPALREAERSLVAELDAITVDDLCDQAIAEQIVEDAPADDVKRPSAIKGRMTITGRRVKIARRLLGWSQEKLAGKLDVEATSIRRFEATNRYTILDISAMRLILEEAGVEFIDGEPGVTLKAKP
jgi:Rrf2 family protein